MALTVSLLGVNYSIPEPGDNAYDQQQLTTYLKNLATSFPQLSGGLYALTAELDLGSSFGVKAPYLKTETATPATAGQVRLAKTDSVKWRNNANSADLALAIDTADALLFNGANVTGNAMLGATSAAGQSVLNATTAIIVYGTVERDSDSAYNSGTGRYTVPTGKGGDYQIEAACSYVNAQTGFVTIAVFKGAVEQKRFATVNPGAGQSNSVTAILNLAAGDIVDIRTSQPAGSAQSLEAVAVKNYFALKRIPT